MVGRSTWSRGPHKNSLRATLREATASKVRSSWHLTSVESRSSGRRMIFWSSQAFCLRSLTKVEYGVDFRPHGERERERQADTQTDRQTDRDRDRHTDRDIFRERQTDIVLAVVFSELVKTVGNFFQYYSYLLRIAVWKAETRITVNPPPPPPAPVL